MIPENTRHNYPELAPSTELASGFALETDSPTFGIRYSSLKRSFDFATAICVLILTAPLIAALMAIVKLTSRGPAIYRQVRLGRNNQPFVIYKIRTMGHDCEKTSGPQWSILGDPRVTPIGRFLRRTHLDELPQLWNVIRGDMSLVGPRPQRPEFVGDLERALPYYRERLGIRPGVTGLAQVYLPPDVDFQSVRRKLVHDLYYVRHSAFALDVKIILCTAGGLLGVPHAVGQKVFGLPRPGEIEATHQTIDDLQDLPMVTTTA